MLKYSCTVFMGTNNPWLSHNFQSFFNLIIQCPYHNNTCPTPPIMGMGGALLNDLAKSFYLERGAFDLIEIQCISIDNVQSQIPCIPHLKNWR